VINKERSISARWCETYGLYVGGETLKPSPRGLFETVQRFLKKTDMIRCSRVFKTKRLLTIDCFVKRTMEKSIFNIELVNRPGRGCGYAKNSANGARFDYRRKGFIIVDAMLLRETATDPASFVSRESAISKELLAKHPFAGNNVSTDRARNKAPSVILKESGKLIAHGSGPVRIKKRTFVGFGKWRNRRSGGMKVETRFGYMKTCFGPSAHGVSIGGSLCRNSVGW
jgi:hypothetical protein